MSASANPGRWRRPEPPDAATRSPRQSLAVYGPEDGRPAGRCSGPSDVTRFTRVTALPLMTAFDPKWTLQSGREPTVKPLYHFSHVGSSERKSFLLYIDGCDLHMPGRIRRESCGLRWSLQTWTCFVRSADGKGGNLGPSLKAPASACATKGRPQASGPRVDRTQNRNGWPSMIR